VFVLLEAKLWVLLISYYLLYHNFFNCYSLNSCFLSGVTSQKYFRYNYLQVFSFKLSEFCVANCILLTYRKAWNSQVEIFLNSTHQTYCLVRRNFETLVARGGGGIFLHQISDNLSILWSRSYVIQHSINSTETLARHVNQTSDHQTGWSHSYVYYSLFTWHNR
jgi:hypothetical protein